MRIFSPAFQPSGSMLFVAGPYPVLQLVFPLPSTRSDSPKLLAVTTPSAANVAMISSASPFTCGRYTELLLPVWVSPEVGLIVIGPAVMLVAERRGSNVPAAGSWTIEPPVNTYRDASGSTNQRFVADCCEGTADGDAAHERMCRLPVRPATTSYLSECIHTPQAAGGLLVHLHGFGLHRGGDTTLDPSEHQTSRAILWTASVSRMWVETVVATRVAHIVHRPPFRRAARRRSWRRSRWAWGRPGGWRGHRACAQCQQRGLRQRRAVDLQLC